jgi:EAL domain-containing protein (putative c-di-GMP-specific phosphodiesterase class I)
MTCRAIDCETARVLVVDDCPFTRRALERILDEFVVSVAETVGEAIDVLSEQHVHTILCDLHLDTTSGLALLRWLRDHELDVPFVLMTGEPDMGTAIEAVDLGASGYLTKPFSRDSLRELVERITHERRLLEAERRTHHRSSMRGELVRLENNLDRALSTMAMAYQPILSADHQSAVGYEALLRSSIPELPHPGAVLDAAERLDRIFDVGIAVRELVEQDAAQHERQDLLFINLHPEELMDDRLLDPAQPIASRAEQVVLELTERQVIGDPVQAARRVDRLRRHGYAIAIDDLGAGYASLNVFAALRPEYVKIDMALARGVESDPFKRGLIRAINHLCADQGIKVVAEGVETVEQRDTLIELGCDLLQGYLFARPAAGFPVPRWGDERDGS